MYVSHVNRVIDKDENDDKDDDNFQPIYTIPLTPLYLFCFLFFPLFLSLQIPPLPLSLSPFSAAMKVTQ